jgi:hypothetical protein
VRCNTPAGTFAEGAELINPIEMDLFKANPPKGPDSRAAGTIGMVTRDTITSPTAISWQMTDYSFLAPHEYVGRFIIQGNVLVQQRNTCVQRMEGDWLLFIDDDMSWQPDALGRIVATQRRTGADIVGGLCFQRGGAHQPTMYRSNLDGTGYAYIEVWEDGDIMPVDATGMAFTLITNEAFSKIVRFVTGDSEAVFPPLDMRMRMPAPDFFRWDGRWGEDLGFCRLAQAAGCRIVVDTGIEIGHVGMHTITKETFLHGLAFRHPLIEEARRASVAPLGLETMTRAEAIAALEAIMEREVRQ